MFVHAGLNVENITNHSSRATGVPSLYSQGVPEKRIRERSGHLSTSGIRLYERIVLLQRKTTSDALSVQSENLATVEEASQLMMCEVNGKHFSEVNKIKKEDKWELESFKELTKHIKFERMNSCTINFNFSHV